MTRKLLLTNRRALGDVVVSTALMRDIKLQYGDEIEIGFHGTHRELLRDVPYLSKLTRAETVSLGYGHREWKIGIDVSTQCPQHFLKAYYEFFTRRTGISVEMTELRPDLHIPDPAPPEAQGRWLAVTGGKTDFTTKIWHPRSWEELFRSAPDEKFARIGALGKNNIHHPIETGENVVDLRGQTDTRGFVAAIRESKGVICGVTAAAHIAAAYDKPCIVIAGGREPWWWEAYTDVTRQINGHVGPKLRNQVYLHNVGQLECCSPCACWRSHLPGRPGKKKFCEHTVKLDGVAYPACLDRITPAHIIQAMKTYA